MYVKFTIAYRAKNLVARVVDIRAGDGMPQAFILTENIGHADF